MLLRLAKFAFSAVIFLTILDSGSTLKAEEALLEQPASLTPVDRPDPWWQARHREKLAEKKGNGEAIQLVFVGDSITHGWERKAKAKAIWDEQFGPYGAFNLGYSGDRTEHVLWRLSDEGGEIKGLDPKLYVVMIGTNNTGHRPDDPAHETIAGIEAIVDRLLENSPSSKVLLLAVFPRAATPQSPARTKNDEVNEGISKIDRGNRLEFLDLSPVFLNEKGMLPIDIMPDLLHPNIYGYQIWADAIEAPIKRLMSE